MWQTVVKRKISKRWRQCSGASSSWLLTYCSCGVLIIFFVLLSILQKWLKNQRKVFKAKNMFYHMCFLVKIVKIVKTERKQSMYYLNFNNKLFIMIHRKSIGKSMFQDVDVKVRYKVKHWQMDHQSGVPKGSRNLGVKIYFDVKCFEKQTFPLELYQLTKLTSREREILCFLVFWEKESSWSRGTT